MEKSKVVVKDLMRRTKPATISQISMATKVSRTYVKEILLRLILHKKAIKMIVNRVHYFSGVKHE